MRHVLTMGSQSQEDAVYFQYYHIAKVYKVKDYSFLPEIAKKLGLKSFLGNNLFLSLSSGEYHSKQFHIIPSLCYSIRLSQLVVCLNKCPIIFKEIALPNYPNLRLLNLSGNQIESIEGLSRLDAPELSYLNLEANLIFEMKEINKIRFQRLKHLAINENRWNELYEHNCYYNLISLQALEINVNSNSSFNEKTRDRYLRQKYSKVLTINDRISLI